MDVANVAEQLELTPVDDNERLRRNLKLIMASDVVTAPELYNAIGLNRTTWSQRFTGDKPTNFTFAQALAIARYLGLTVEQLVLPAEQLMRLVGQRQNWKKLNRSDLGVVTGGGKSNGMRSLLVRPVS